MRNRDGRERRIIRRTRELVAARLDPKTYLGLHLTVGLVVAALGVWAFGALLDAVLDNATLVRFDVASAAWVHERMTSPGLSFFTAMTNIGSPAAMTALGIVGGVMLLLRGHGLTLIAWTAAFAGGGILDRLLKAVVHRTRPIFDPAQIAAGSFSFPSGHAMGSFIGFSFVAYVFLRDWRASRRWRVPVLIACPVLIVLVGISRIYLGKHYPSDVLGAWAAAAAWMGICVSGLGVAVHRRARRGAT